MDSKAEYVVLRLPVTDLSDPRDEVDLQVYLRQLVFSPVRSLEDIIDFNDAHADIEFPPNQCCQQVIRFVYLRIDVRR